MRDTITKLGGEVRFSSKVETLQRENGQITGVTLASGEHIEADHVVLAIGHSARDTFQMLHDQGVFMEAKPFSVGFRIEHPQSLIDKARWCTTPATGDRYTASACAPAARWWRQPLNPIASSPTA
ncbi:hypothetical protein G6F57_019804 [Rhizopus arrhizus]|nr:hypothetical protein G6F57_019804 [Rhizopus arrhizus]